MSDQNQKVWKKKGRSSKREARAVQVPDAVIVAGDHPENIAARRQVGVGDLSLAGFRAPAAVEAAQHGFETVSFRHQETEGGKSELEFFAPGIDERPARQVQGQPVHGHFFNEHRRHALIALAVIGVHDRHALDGREPQLAVAAFPAGRLGRARAFDPAHTLGYAEREGVDARNATVGEIVQLLLADAIRPPCCSSSRNSRGRPPGSGKPRRCTAHSGCRWCGTCRPCSAPGRRCWCRSRGRRHRRDGSSRWHSASGRHGVEKR